ncbi:protein containg bacterial PH domain [Longilinea arvoryzae]|uniref:Protein containg bacterial PH domain n=1 Tax=Longilinea arvoryzae TaxID=360412 RepID=A0A0S7BPA0_9CHLR|nr:PH domain-containing protein [Longilinea arvoryzae]GAP15642.1 protein containg bacterial PH domain [Longilinea arvoryzae]
MNSSRPVSTGSIFPPPRKRGLITLSSVIVVCGLAGTACLLFSMQQQVGALFVIFLLLTILFYVPIPLAAYRAYALTNASYTLERDGLRLRWGLRAEDIPLPEIEWVRPAAELGFRLPLPLLAFAGGLLGARILPELGLVEFVASEEKNLLLVATPRKVYAISPADPGAFVHAFQRAIELGSLAPLPAYSSQPEAFLARVWRDAPARLLLLTGLGLTLGLLVLASLLIPGRAQISLGFNPAGLPLEAGPAARLLLLPVLAAFCYVADLILGLFFYRNDPQRPVAYLLWVAGVLTPLLLIFAVIGLV